MRYRVRGRARHGRQERVPHLRYKKCRAFRVMRNDTGECDVCGEWLDDRGACLNEHEHSAHPMTCECSECMRGAPERHERDGSES